MSEKTMENECISENLNESMFVILFFRFLLFAQCKLFNEAILLQARSIILNKRKNAQ